MNRVRRDGFLTVQRVCTVGTELSASENAAVLPLAESGRRVRRPTPTDALSPAAIALLLRGANHDCVRVFVVPRDPERGSAGGNKSHGSPTRGSLLLQAATSDVCEPEGAHDCQNIQHNLR